MGWQRKLLLSFMVGGLILFYGVTATAALTPSVIKEIANDSMVFLSIIDGHGKRWTGSGFVVHDSYIATNYHVVENVIIGRAKLVDKKKWHFFIGPILATDKEHDLAVVKVAGMNAPALRLGDSDTVKIGETIYVAGNPSGPEGRAMEGTVTIGSIRKIRTEDILMGGKPLRGKKLQIDASIEPGSSGGPVLDDSGEVIGISVGGYPGTGEEEYVPLGYNYAIAVNHLKQLAKRANIPITTTSRKISPIMKHVPPSRVSVGDQIPLTLDLISSKAPRQVTIVYKTYDKDDNKLEQPSQEMRLSPQPSASSSWSYTVDLPSQKRVGSIKYYIEVEYNNRVAFRYPRDQSRYYRIPIIDDKRPIISVLYPPEDASFTVNEQITFRAEVIDNSIVEEVRIYLLAPNDRSQKLSKQGSSDIYTMDLLYGQVGTVEYYLTATDEAGKESRSENRRLTIIPLDTTPPTIRLIKPSRTTFEVDQQIPIEAKVTDGSSVKQVRLFYSFSPSKHFSHYFDRFLTETSSDTYTGHIPPQSKVGYTEYYLTATDEAGNKSKSKARHIEITLPPPPPVTPPEPERPRPVMLNEGIKLYEQAKYSEAIEALSSAIQEIENPIHQAEAYLYLGGAKRGAGASNDTVKEEFRKAICHNPNQKLPPRVGEDHPIFAELLEAVRKELTGELTVISLVPQTQIWIEGNNIDKKMLGTERVSSRLLRGSYTVEGIYADGSQRKTVRIELDRHEILYIPPIVEHKHPRSISVGERILLSLNLISSEAPQQVTIYYKVYDRDGNELEEKNQEMHLGNKQLVLSTWIYRLDLPSQKRIGLVEYYIALEYDNQLAFRYPRPQSLYYQIPILDDKPPTISVLYPHEGERFTVNQQITVRAEVTDNSVVKEVRVHFSSGNSQTMPEEGSSGVYAIEDIKLSQAGSVEYYLTATDEAGNKKQSESRHIDIRLEEPPEPPPVLPDADVESGQSDDPTESGISKESDQQPISENKPPTINLLDPPKDAQFTVNEQITIRAKVTDDIAVKEVRVHFSSGNSQTMSEEGSSGMYVTDISFSQAGSVEYYLTATDEAGNKSKSKARHIDIRLIPPPPEPPPAYPIYQGIWASVSADDASTPDRDGSNTFRLAYLREGKTHRTLGAQLDFSPDRSNMSAMFQWGATLGKSKVAFTLLGGIAAYGDSPRSTHTTPIFGGGLKFYPRDNIVIDTTSSIKFRSDFDTTALYHYEVGIRFYITPELGLRAGYGRLFLGDEDVTTLQVGFGVNF